MANYNRLKKIRNLVGLALALALTGALVTGCNKDDNEEPIDLGYDFFPNNIGTFIEYEVDSLNHDLVNDTTHFFLREVLVEEFVDNEGQLAVRVERYKRTSSNDDWTISDVWVQKRTTTTAERVEENLRFVRLAFPINQQQSWNGNAYNTLGAWEHSYQNVYETQMYNGLVFHNTITVMQVDNVNLIDQEQATEVYARDIGLIYKKFVDLSFQFGTVTGIEMTMSVTNYGTVE